MNLRKQTQTRAQMLGRNDALAGKPHRTNALPGSAWEKWYTEGYDSVGGKAVVLTAAQLADIRALVAIGASDARHAAKLPDYTDDESANLERLADTAPGLIALLETPATPVDWQVSWHITLDKDDAETPEAAAMVALDYGYRQFRRALGYREDATRPAMVVNGLDVDLEEGAQ